MALPQPAGRLPSGYASPFVSGQRATYGKAGAVALRQITRGAMDEIGAFVAGASAGFIAAQVGYAAGAAVSALGASTAIAITSSAIAGVAVGTLTTYGPVTRKIASQRGFGAGAVVGSLVFGGLTAYRGLQSLGDAGAVDIPAPNFNAAGSAVGKPSTIKLDLLRWFFPLWP